MIDFIMTCGTYILLTIQVTAGEMPPCRFAFDDANDHDDNFGENSSDTTGQDTDDSDGGEPDGPDVCDDVLFYPIPPLREIKGFFRRYVQSD